MQITRERLVDEVAERVRARLTEAFEQAEQGNVDFAELAERLGNGFDWQHSPQGFQFWQAVTQALYALAARKRA